MSKRSDLITEISQALQDQILSPDDVLQLVSEAKHKQQDKHTGKFALDISQILSFVGALIVFLGVSFYVSLQWDTLSDTTQVLITLGGGILAFVLGTILLKKMKLSFVGLSLHVLAALLIPSGIFVWLSKLPQPETSQIFLILTSVYSLLLVVYLAAFYFFRKSVFIFFSSVWATIVTFSSIFWILSPINLPGDVIMRIVIYTAIGIALAHILAGKYLDLIGRTLIGKYFISIGSLAIFATTFALAQIDKPWEYLFSLVVLLGFVVSVSLRSRWTLVWSVGFLVIYLFYLTSKYFVDTIGWPIALMILGFCMILVGYGTVRLNQLYFSKKSISS